MRTSSSQLDQSSAAPRGFALKGGLFPLTLLELLHHDLDDLERELSLKAKQAPGFFNQAPVILSVEQIDHSVDIDLGRIESICQGAGLCIVALREARAEVDAQAKAQGLAVLPKSRARTAGHRPVEIEFPGEQLSPPGAEPSARSAPPAGEVAEVAQLPEVPAHVESGDGGAVEPGAAKLITQPIRSGQQVYAPGGDLVVVAPVSAGAELLADGNIHVYGALRGRALAGVKGDRSARIFCQRMEAELLSIAGHFKMEEELSDSYRGKQVQVFLRDNCLNIEALSAKDR